MGRHEKKGYFPRARGVGASTFAEKIVGSSLSLSSPPQELLMIVIAAAAAAQEQGRPVTSTGSVGVAEASVAPPLM